MPIKYLKNAWYAAAWADEIEQSMSEQTICSESILLFRDKKNQIHAMENTCSHRYAPLHQGKLIDDCIECPYHALKFNTQGKCIHNPNGNNMIPGNSDLRVYPVVEQHNLIWVWTGDPTLADVSTIPDFSCLVDPEFKTVKGTLNIDAYYEMITDNLMDLTHAVTVHEGLLGSEAIARGENKVEQEGTTVWSNSWCPDGMAPPAWDHVFDDYGKPVDHWLNMRWDAPAHMLLDVGITPTGQSRNDGIWVYGTDILTPVSEKETLYFWGITRNHHIDDPKFDEMWRGAIKAAFEGQDKPMIEIQQAMLTLRGAVDIDDVSHASLSTDAGPVRSRYVLRKLMDTEDDGDIPLPKNPDLKTLQNKAAASDKVEIVV